MHSLRNLTPLAMCGLVAAALSACRSTQPTPDAPPARREEHRELRRPYGLPFDKSGANVRKGDRVEPLSDEPPPDERSPMPLPTPDPPGRAVVEPRLEAERYEPAIDAQRVRPLASGNVRRYAFTADSTLAVYQDAQGLLHAVDLSTRRDDVVSQTPVTFFVLTPDSRYALVPGAAIARLPLRPQRQERPLQLAPNESLSSLSALIVSPDARWAAFTSNSGALVVTSVVDGSAHTLEVPLPADGRYHFGAGYLHRFSRDSTRLLYHHGGRYESIRLDGSERLDLGLAGPELVGDTAVGLALDPSSGFELVQVHTGAAQRLTVPNLHGFSQPRGAPDGRMFVFAGSDGTVRAAELASRRVRLLYPGPLEATMFLEHLPDSSGLLYAARGPTPQGFRCEARWYDFRSQRDAPLLAVVGGDQCFAKPAGPRRAVVHAWTSSPLQVSLYAVDLATRTVQRLFEKATSPGNFDTSPDGRYALFDAGGTLYLVTL